MGRISKLHEYTLDRINSKFPHLKARENYYPDWLLSPVGTRLELDIFIDDLKIAAEIQGGQHSFFVPFFHGTKENFEKQKQYDEHKKDVCRIEGVKLYDIATEKDADVMIYEIDELINAMDKNTPTYLYQEIQRNTKSAIRKRNKKNTLGNIDNSEAARIERVNKCKEKISQHNNGLFLADKEKLEVWRRVIENNGFADAK